jgi:hypothetical protein
VTVANVLDGELSTKGHMTLDEQRALMKRLLLLGKREGLAEAVPADSSREEWREKVESSRFSAHTCAD